jgi:crotonobetainyl-CoA hydratase
MTDTTGTTDRTGPAATLEKRGAVALITLNRPYAMNAVNADLSGAVGAALEELDADPELRVGIITGSGRAFCAGADLKGINAGDDLTAPGHSEWGFAGLIEHAISKPLIAAVNGFALGGGTEIVLRCDLAVLSEDAALGLPEVKRGLFAAAGGLIMMPRQLPAKIAMEAALIGAPITPETALRWDLVNRVVPAADVLDEAFRLAEGVAAGAPLAIQASKRLVDRASGGGSDWDADAWRLNDELIAQILTSDDMKEGTAAFAEKRAPRWSGS